MLEEVARKRREDDAARDEARARASPDVPPAPVPATAPRAPVR